MLTLFCTPVKLDYAVLEFLYSEGTISKLIKSLEDTSLLLVKISAPNTGDNVLGECLSLDIPTDQTILLTTGRLSSQIVFKAKRAKIPLVVSMKSPIPLESRQKRS